MKDKESFTRVIQDVLLLYELALATGQSLNLEENCDLFLQRLMRRKNLSYSAVWIKNSYLTGTNREEGATLVYANPDLYPRSKYILPDHFIYNCIKDAEILVVDSASKDFHKLIDEEGVKHGTYAVFPLNDIGCLKLFSFTEKEKSLSREELHKLKKVIDKFAFSLKGSLSHQQLIAETIEREKITEALRESEERYRFLTENILDVIWTADLEGNLTYISPAIEKMSGYTLKEFIAMPLSEHFDREDYNAMMARLAEELEKPPAEQVRSAILQARVKAKDKCGVPVKLNISWLFDAQGNIIGVQGSTRDITERMQVEEALKESEMRSRALIGAIPDLLFRYSREGVYLDAVVRDERVLHPQARKFFRQNRLIGKSVAEVLPPPLAEKLKSAIIKTLERGKIQILEYSYPANNSARHFEARLAPICTTEVVSIVRDITERKNYEADLQYISLHDQLTGLYNRHYLEEEMKRLDTKRQLPISMIMADLNGLKLVNDTYGHHTGDEMLKRAAAVLKQSCREEDIIARFGGDEFVIYLPRTPENEASEIVNRIDQVYRKEFIKKLPITMSFGVAAKNRTDQKLVDVLKEAEDRMYRNKLTESRSSKNTVVNTLLKTLAEKSYETEVHTGNMQEAARRIGEKLGLPDSEMSRLNLLIALHDIGKINLPEGLLTKNGPLSQAEWEVMKKHSETGFRIARATEEFAHVANDILAHHEYWDGSGYPQGLKGKAIPLLARITAVADAFEVMSNGRPYKKAMAPEAIMAEFRRCAGTQFDPELVEIFLALMEDENR